VHSVSLITTVAAGLGLALAFGLLAARAGLPPLVGYLIAGIVIGPATPGFVADLGLARQLAEIGVMLMMFGVGLHFSLDDLMEVRRVAIPGALVQMTVATVLGVLTARLWGWSGGASFIFGLALSVPSTVVVLRTLESRGVMASSTGRVAMGWLVVQDLVVVLILVFLPAIVGAGGVSAGSLATSVALTLGKVAAFVALMFAAGRWLLPRLLWQVAGTGSRELFTLTVISSAVGVAYLSATFFSVSFALGAFFAGMMMGESDFSHRAARESLPLRDAFSVLFFVSVGMLFEPSILLREPGKVAAVVGVVLLGNAVASSAFLLAFRYTAVPAFTIGVGLAQIGEFSFILAALGVSLGVLSADAQSLILAGSLVSITLNPFLFKAIERLPDFLRSHKTVQEILERSDDPLAELPKSVDSSYVTGHVLLVGHGRVGSRIAAAMRDAGVRYVVVEENREQVEALRDDGVHAVFGDASEAMVIVQGHVARARLLVIATPDTLKARQMIKLARALNPPIEVLLRTHSDEEAELAEQEGLGRVFMGEQELAAAMTEEVMTRMAATRAPNSVV
jgi:monovalent cation:H+ antiporter-2, CPA2 family